MKKTKVFKSGNSCAIRLPKEMAFRSGQKVLIEKMGSLTVIVDEKDPWAALKLSQLLISQDFMVKGRSKGALQERRSLSEIFKT